MKIYCISDTPEVEIGLKLAGCDGICLDKNCEIEDKIDEVLKNQEIGVMVVTKNIYEKAKDKIDFIRLNKKLPIIAVI